MGAGRKTETFIVSEGSKFAPSTVNGKVSSRNLNKDDLGGVIFGCKHTTMKECLSNQIFGLPSSHIFYVRNIYPGLPLFLFNYSDRKLHGIYEAASYGQMNINPYGWSADGSEKTQYPAQVRVCIREQCQPLSENQFKGVIHENFYTLTHFWFELDYRQVEGLLAMFRSTGSASFGRAVVNQADSKKGNPVKVLYNPKSQATWSSKTNFLLSEQSSFAEVDPKKKLTSPTSLTRGNKYNILASDDWGEDECSSSSKVSSSMHEDFDDKRSVSEWELPPLEPQSDHEIAEIEEEEVVLFKVKQLIMDSEQSNRSCTNTATDDMIGNTVLGDENCCNNGIAQLREDICSVDEIAQFRQDICSGDKEIPDSEIAQLRQDIDELRNIGLEQVQRIALLEARQVESNSEIRQLKARVSELEIKLGPSKSNSIFLIGGHDGTSWLSTLDIYSPSNDIVKSLRPMNSARSYASSATLNGHIYVFGGGNGTSFYDTVESYNPSSNEWSECPPLSCKKGSLAGAALGNKIFAFGGGNGTHIFREVEMLDPLLGRWISNPEMLQKRFAPAAAELKGSLYVIGGYDGEKYLKSAERFDPREGSWTTIESMATGRGSHCVAVLNEKLYTLGGYDGESFVSSVQLFDPVKGSWMMGEPLINPRGYGAAAVLGDSIYVIGGYIGEEPFHITDTVECFREGLGWRDTGSKAFGKRCFLSAVVL